MGRFIAELEADGDVVTIRLEELDEAASTELVESVASERLSASALREVVGLAGGNPFFLVELTADYVADRTPERRGDGAPLPLSVRQMIARRIRELDPVAKQIVSGLSVFVHPTSLGRLTRMTGFAREECVDGLETLQKLRLVDWAEGGVSCRHDIVRRAVYDGLSPARRSLLHGRIAEMLESEPGDPPKDQLALHYYKAGERELALKYALEAADEAEASGGNAEEIRYVTMAVELSKPRDRPTLHRRLAHLYHLDRDLKGAEEWLPVALADALAEGDEGGALDLESTLVEVRSETGSMDVEEALRRLALIEARARSGGLPEALVESLERRIRILDREGRWAEITEVLRRGEVLSLDSDPAAACGLHCLLSTKLFFGEASEALGHARRAVDIAKDAGVPRLKLRAFTRMLVVLSHLGKLDTDEGRRVVGEAFSVSKDSGDVLARYLIRANVGVWYLDTGQLDLARSSFGRIQAEAEKSQARRPRLELAVNFGELALLEGDFDQALALFQQARLALYERAPFYARAFVLAGEGMSLLRIGRIRAAKEISEQLEGAPLVWHSDQVLWVDFLGEIEAKQGRWEGADDLLREHELKLEGRLPVLWLKLRLARTRRLRRWRPEAAVGLAEEGRDFAASLGLVVRQGQFERLVA